MKNKNNNLEEKLGTSFDEMKSVSKELLLDINEVYCGYLRQPISTIKKDTHYQIVGTCALNRERCFRFVAKDTQFRVEWCERYRNLYGR